MRSIGSQNVATLEVHQFDLIYFPKCLWFLIFKIVRDLNTEIKVKFRTPLGWKFDNQNHLGSQSEMHKFPWTLFCHREDYISCAHLPLLFADSGRTEALPISEMCETPIENAESLFLMNQQTQLCIRTAGL
jgi:hypothetical protein